MPRISVSIAVEGGVDEIVARRILALSGAEAGMVMGRKGKTWLDAKMASFAAVSQYEPWLVLRDLDRDGCAPELVRRLMPRPGRFLVIRFVEHAVEAWLMADGQALADALAVPVARIPAAPETVLDPKRCLVDLARRSRRTEIRRRMVPREGSGAVVGPEYESWTTNFARTRWSSDRAAATAPGLQRAIERVHALVDQARQAS